MKILNVIDLMNPGSGGGATTRSYDMSRFLALRGANIDVLTTNWDLEIEYVAKLREVNWHSVNAVHFRYLFPFGAKAWLRSNISNYDVVHISKNWSVLASLAANAAYENDIPYVFSGMGLVSMRSRSRMLKWLYTKYLSIPMMRRASSCIAVTIEEKTALIKAGVSENRVHVIPNGVVLDDLLHKDNSHFRIQHHLDERKIMLFVGRMDSVKGVDILIDAFEKNRLKLKDWILVLVGTDTLYRMQMQEKVIALNLSNNVHFLNPLFGKEKSEAYHAAEFVVIPSIKDAMTIIAPEAACCAKPVLLTNTCDFGELANCGGAIEVDPTIDGLTYGLDILTNDSFDRAGMGKKGYEYVTNKFRWENLAGTYIDIFESASGRTISLSETHV
jgi:glycosyltransferase involved in cell wall biosynthesis